MEHVELRQRLAEAEATLEALRLHEVDAIIGSHRVMVLRLEEIERAKRHSEQMYRTVGESLDYGVWTCDAQGKCEFVSDSFLHLVGMTLEAVQEFGWTKCLPPDDVQPTLEKWATCVRTGQDWDQEHRIQGRDGQWHTVLSRARPLRGKFGEITGWAGINLDITGRKQIEQALSEANRQKDDFLATLAHELRNPLASIQHAVEVIRLIQNQDGQQAVEVIDHEVKYLTHLIDDLLDVSRIARGKIRLKKSHLDAATLVWQAVETVRPQFDSRKHTLSVDASPEQMPILVDPTRLQQVLINLLTNAAKYTPDEGRVFVSVAPENDEVVFRVSDTGIGISEEMMPQIFELFSQANQSLDRSYGGLGIGLSVVRRLVEMHRGSISAKSAGLGHGSEFVVRLPLVEASSNSDRLDRPQQIQSEHQLRILIIEDSDPAAQMLRLLLASKGHTVQIASDGVQGIERALEFHPHVVLLDLGLPGLDGYEVAKRLRQEEPTKDVKIIGLSGYGQSSIHDRAREAGFDDHLVKPVEFDKLSPLLRRRDAQ